MYHNSLILRLCITDYPFVHKNAITNGYSSFIYNKSVAKIIPHILEEKGVINIGGKKREIYKFARKFGNKKIKKIPRSKIKNFPKDSSIKIKSEIIEQLWKILISDNNVDLYESNLMRRICGLIYFSDKESGEIKMRLIKSK